MTPAQLEPFLGRTVAVRHHAGLTVTGRLERGTAPEAYRIVSVDGEVPPVDLAAHEITGVDG